jgi:hypothetical protein
VHRALVSSNYIYISSGKLVAQSKDIRGLKLTCVLQSVILLCLFRNGSFSNTTPHKCHTYNTVKSERGNETLKGIMN